eukprot:TRINITY_DN3123_c0_g1_i1.p2 TRINITY_DN3123_c0_g1~~TRINITY_DN3123_c0_g1_i1.p2  ORF type:complete len:148 (+),score=33.02 TRINITY_DN3123_c0_g1_i1:206-649(+)
MARLQHRFIVKTDKSSFRPGFIKGVDVAPGEIQEAQVRYRELVAESNSSGKKIPRVDFAVNAHCGDRLIDWGRKFNVVSVMFALHYFFKTSEMLDKLLANVAAALQPNGFFVGTVPNGRRVMEVRLLYRAPVEYQLSSSKMRWKTIS